MRLVLQLIKESQIKSKTVVVELAKGKKERAFFVPFMLSEEIFFKICVLF